MAAARSKPIVKIFIAYPGDCKAARASIVSIIRDPDYRWHEYFDIRLVYWEDPDQPMLGDWNTAPQSSVVQHVGHPGDCDLLIALLRHRIGSPLPEAEYGRDEFNELWTGTVWELAQAAGAGKGCWVFRDTCPQVIDQNWPEDQIDAAQAQAKAVRQFFTRRVRDADGAYCRGVDEHHGPETVAEMAREKLRRWFADRLNSDPSNLLQRADSSASADLNAAQHELLERIIEDKHLDYDALDAEQQQRFDVLLAEVCQAPTDSLQAFLLKRYAYWANRDGGRLQTRFVKLDLQIHRGPGSEQGFYEKRGETHDSLSALLAANRDVRGLVLTGDPGCGKTTILQHHELHSAATALRMINAPASADTALELCLWHRLSGFGSDDTPAAWLQAQQGEVTDQQLRAWRQREPRLRVRYLLDGINEIRVNSDRQYREGLRDWSAWAAQGEARGELAPIFSVRRRNLSSALTSGELQIHQISVQRWTDSNIREYINHRFAADGNAGAALWQQIDADPRLREQCSLPLDLKHQCDIYATLGRPAHSRAELFGALCWQRLQRLHSREALDDLLHDSDIRALDRPAQWKRRLLALPDRGPLLQTLYAEAAAMHTAGVQIERDEESLALALDEDTRRLWCDAMLKLPFLEEVSDENPALRFIHQNWQEYFAGVALAQMPPDQWPDFSPPALPDLNDVRDGLGNLDPLPGPPISHWDEAAKFAVQIATGEQRQALLQRLRQQNLALAGRALAALQSLIGSQPDQALDAAWTDQLREALLQRSRDPAIDVRVRIEAGEALGEVGDPRYATCTSDEGVRYLIPKAEYWIDFPAGSYTIGSDEGSGDEKPPIQVELEPFSVAFATVTNAEYRCFIDDDGYRDSRWWPGVAGEWVRGEWRDQFNIDWWQERLTAIREIIEQIETDQERIIAIKALPLSTNLTEAQAETWLNNGKLDESFVDQRLEQLYGAGDPKSEPEYWRTGLNNQPSQPVVGVTVFEAQAYCLWLAHLSAQALQLPTEGHWEAAARCVTGRLWPFVVAMDDAAEQFNCELSHLRRAAPAGCFPWGDSAEGLLDMAGNVWEWTATAYQAKLTPDTVLARASADQSVTRVLRGGACNGTVFDCRASYRSNGPPGNRNSYNGFRLFSCPIHEH